MILEKRKASLCVRCAGVSKHNVLRFVLKGLLLGVSVTVLTFIGILAYVLYRGVPAIDSGLFSPVYTSENCSLVPALLNTLTVTALSLLISVPLGVFAAIYLSEYSKRGSRLVPVIWLTTQTLSGVPSIIYGLFGYLMFVRFLGFDYSLLSGILTLCIMILPVIITTSEEALRSVPDTFREGSFGLGAGKLRTVFKIVLPSAVSGILAGIILSSGRILGETAALIYTSGTSSTVPKTLLGSGRTLAVHLFSLFNEGLNMDKAYATAVVLLVITALINALSSFAAGKLTRNKT